MTTTSAGFTLVEVLVTLVVFAMLSLAGTAILGQSLSAKAQSDDVNRAIKDLQVTNALMRSDFTQMVSRTARDGFGARSSATVVTGAPGEPFVTFVRNGWDNPGGLAARSSLQRVEYLVRDGNLVRRSFPFVDGMTDAEGYEQVLMSGVSNVNLSYLLNDTWQAGWRATGSAVVALPEAVAIELSSQAFGDLRQLFLAPGGTL